MTAHSRIRDDPGSHPIYAEHSANMLNALHLKGQGADVECSTVLHGLLTRASDDAIVVLHGLLELTSE